MDSPPREGKSKMPKLAKVKNKMPAPVQITAEQLLREAKERELELVQPPPKQKVSDPDELAEYRLRKRKAFEDNIRKNRTVMINWIKYAAWEESQKEIQRARSVYERALDVDHRNITVWLKYAEMEMKNRQINHARNVWDRAVTILPRANQFWYKYTYMEEMLKNVAGCRQVFERWMEWEPEEQAWHSYINFELRYKELDRARGIYERFVMIHSEVKNWLKYAKFEEKHSYINSARRIFERAIEFFGDDNMDEHLLIGFAKFEEGQREHERARVIYKYALDHLPKEKCQDIYKQYTIHEKKYGDREGIEDVIVSKRKFQYEEEVKVNPHNYDAWFDYLRLMESDGDAEQVGELYERAIANVPPSQEKRHWRRYIYLWINYALYEELETEDIDRCRAVYEACLQLIPHKKFTFAKIWLLFAQFEVRQKNLTRARKILGTSIGKCPKDKLFRGYIEMEIQLREFDRCRILYDKFLAFNPENCTTWMKYTELETLLGEVDRARSIFELAINQPRLDMPEVLWKSYIDFEIEEQEYDNVRGLYKRLLQRTQHVKVWISYAQFELSIGGDDAIECSRKIYSMANKELRKANEKEERLMLLESWKDFEMEYGDEESQASIKKLMPNKIKRRREITNEDGSSAGWEEYYDYIFPDDESAKPNLKLLAMAKQWKMKLAQGEVDEDKDEDTTEVNTTEADVDTEVDQKEKLDEEKENVPSTKSKWDEGDVNRKERFGDSDSDSGNELSEKCKPDTAFGKEENKKNITETDLISHNEKNGTSKSRSSSSSSSSDSESSSDTNSRRKRRRKNKSESDSSSSESE